MSNSTPTCGRRIPLVSVAVAMSSGIAWDRWSAFPVAASLLLIGIGLAVWLCFHLRRNSSAAAVSLLVAIAGCGAVWHHLCWDCFDRHELGRYAQVDRAPACLIVIAEGEPIRTPAPPDNPMRVIPVGERSRLVVRVEKIRDEDHWLPATGKATLLCEGHLLGVSAGDRLKVFAQLARPESPSGAGDFDYQAFLRSRRELTQLYAAYPDCVVSLERRSAGIGGLFARWRATGNRLLWHYIDRQQAGLAAAVLLGERGELDRERSEAFVRTGTVHLLAISGLHVGILAGVLFFILNVGWAPRRWVLLAICALVLLYAGLTDARPPVLRASILVIAVSMSIYSGRRISSFNTLAAAAIVVLAINPAELFSVGAQLSFLAVATLMVLRDWEQSRPADPLRQLIRRTRPWPQRQWNRFARWFAKLTIAGLAIWLVALPLILHHFHVVSPAGIVLTPLLIPVLTGALLAGMVVLCCGWLIPPLADVAGAIAGGFLASLETTVQAASNVPGSYFYLPGPAAWWIAGFYMLLAGAVFPPIKWRPRPAWLTALLFGWIAIGFAWPVATRTDDRLDCTFISVGHGCAVLLELPNGELLLYDAGRLGNPGPAVETISQEIWSRGKRRIDAIVISHGDADHYNAIPRLLERFEVGVVFVSPVMLESESRAVGYLIESLHEADIPLRTIKQNDRLRTGDVAIEVLHPTAEGVFGLRPEKLDNANSIVLSVEYQGQRILLPGDLEPPGVEDVMAELPYDCDVLMAPHHGSRRSVPHGFAAWCTPEWTIVSGGRGLDLQDASQAYGAGQGTLFHTAITGNVLVRIADKQITVTPFREPRAAKQ